jgi:hypothetical protein
MPSFPGTFRSFVKFFLQLSRISAEYPGVGRVEYVTNVPKKPFAIMLWVSGIMLSEFSGMDYRGTSR